MGATVEAGLIGIGWGHARRVAAIESAVKERGLEHVVVLYPKRFPLAYAGAAGVKVEHVEYADIIRYVYYYRLLQEIGAKSLVVVHECLRTQNRNDLTYNCIRHFIAQTDHVLIFQQCPMIDKIDDFGALFDFATKSRWKSHPFEDLPLHEAEIVVEPKTYAIEATTVEADAKTKEKYAEKKQDLFENIGLKDPHTIPRNLHLIGGKVRASALREGLPYVVRNQRLKLDRITPTYASDEFPNPCGVLDFPHRFIDWSDFLALSGQSEVEAVVSDLKVDQWYLDRFQQWCQRVNDAQAVLHR